MKTLVTNHSLLFNTIALPVLHQRATNSIGNLTVMELRFSFGKETRKFDHFRV